MKYKMGGKEAMQKCAQQQNVARTAAVASIENRASMARKTDDGVVEHHSHTHAAANSKQGKKTELVRPPRTTSKANGYRALLGQICAYKYYISIEYTIPIQPVDGRVFCSSIICKILSYCCQSSARNRLVRNVFIFLVCRR